MYIIDIGNCLQSFDLQAFERTVILYSLARKTCRDAAIPSCKAVFIQYYIHSQGGNKGNIMSDKFEFTIISLYV
jgi:hypothetical protein